MFQGLLYMVRQPLSFLYQSTFRDSCWLFVLLSINHQAKENSESNISKSHEKNNRRNQYDTGWFRDHTAVVPDEEVHQHYTDLINSGDVILYGRITYQLMEYWRPFIKNPSEINQWMILLRQLTGFQKLYSPIP